MAYYGDSLKVSELIMIEHKKAGEIPDPHNKNGIQGALRRLQLHAEVLDHADRFLALTEEETAESNMVSGTNIQNLLNLLPQRVRVDIEGMSKAVPDEKERKIQYKKFKKWITDNIQILLAQGVKAEETNRSEITLVANTNDSQMQQQQGRWSNKQPNYQSTRKDSSGQKPPRSQYNGNSQTSGQQNFCGFCNLIKEKRSPKLTNLSFEETHYNIKPGKAPFATNCLRWLLLSIDERNDILRNTSLFCKICLKLLGMNTAKSGTTCKEGTHVGKITSAGNKQTFVKTNHVLTIAPFAVSILNSIPTGFDG